LGDQKDLANDNAIYFATTVGPSLSAIFVAADRSIALAREEFMSVLGGGLPPAHEGGPLRPVVIISCDQEATFNTSQILIDQGNYMVDQVRTPAIFGPVPSFLVADLAQNVTIPKKTLLFTPAGSAVAITELPGRKGLLYRLASKAVLVNEAQAAFVPMAEDLVRTRLGMAPSEPLRIVYAHDDTVDGSSDSAIFTSYVRSKLQPGDELKDIAFGDPTEPTYPQEFAGAVTATVDFEPHLVLMNGLDTGTYIVDRVEKSWSDTATPYRPLWVLSPAQTGGRPSLESVVGNNELLRKRVLGIKRGPPTDDTDFASYAQQYESNKNTNGDAPAGTLSAAAYDEVYLTLFATIALADQPLTGENLGKAVRERLTPPGTKIHVGLNDIGLAVTTLSTGGRIDLYGASGKLDFDENGDVDGDQVVYCLDTNPLLVSRVIDAGVVWRYETKTLEGTLSSDCSFD
jgi:hypothetical protein